MTTPLEHLAIAEAALMLAQSEGAWTAIIAIRKARTELSGPTYRQPMRKPPLRQTRSVDDRV